MDAATAKCASKPLFWQEEKDLDKSRERGHEYARAALASCSASSESLNAGCSSAATAAAGLSASIARETAALSMAYSFFWHISMRPLSPIARLSSA